MSDKGRTIAIVGNPNSGKTTVFNGLTASRQRVGNWPGVTVEKKQGTMMIHSPSFDMVSGRYRQGGGRGKHYHHAGCCDGRHGGPNCMFNPQNDLMEELPQELKSVEVIDLPGIYSLSAFSEDEIIARDFVVQGDYDLVVCVVDAVNLERNLYLTLQLIEMNVPMLLVLNKIDRAEAQGVKIDIDHLAHHLGCPVVAAAAVCRRGIQQIRIAVQEALEQPHPANASVQYPPAIESLLSDWAPVLQERSEQLRVPARYAALRLIEGDSWIQEEVQGIKDLPASSIEKRRAEVASALHEDLDIVIADARYGFIHGLTRDVVRRKANRQSITEHIDSFVMNRWLGIPFFLLSMYLVFWTTISFGGAFIDFFDILFGAIFVDGFGSLLNSFGTPSWLVAILADGIGAGIQTVATFIPIIFMMFFMLSLLEDSGYMSRAAFVMDRLMRLIGLPGKAFVPMLVGFGCTVPAITATRTLDTRKDRFMTIFMSPFMSCGARLPVYALFAAAFFPEKSGLVVFSIYVIGVVLAILTGVLLKYTIFGGEYAHFVMELPPYHAPRVWSIAQSAGSRLKTFIVRAGITITMVVTLLSVLNSLGTDGSFGQQDTSQSVLAAIGRSVTPVFGPMGIEQDNWPATVGLFTGLFAKEAIVGSLGSLYSSEDVVDTSDAADTAGAATSPFIQSLVAAFRSIPENVGTVVSDLLHPFGFGTAQSEQNVIVVDPDLDRSVLARMRANFNGPAAYAYLLFVLIYFPCTAALAAAIREMGAGFGWLLAGYLTALAWAIATLVYQFATGPQLVPLILAVSVLLGLVVLFRIIGNISRRAA